MIDSNVFERNLSFSDLAMIHSVLYNFDLYQETFKILIVFRIFTNGFYNLFDKYIEGKFLTRTDILIEIDSL